MQRATVVVSAVIHVGVAVALMGAAQKGTLRKAISVAVSDVKKKKAEVPKPPPPAPRPVAHHAAPKVVASLPKPSGAEPKAAPAPRASVQTALSMSNDDAPGGIGLLPALHPAAAAAGAAPTRVASAVSSARTRRTREALDDQEGGAAAPGAAPCTEEPTKPSPVYKTEIEYTAAARAEGIEGKLKLKLIVAADGSVSDVEVISSVEAALDAVAIAAARLWRFKPAMRCGQPIAGGTYILSQRYELTD